MQTVLITGGAGSLGREFVRLLDKQYLITVVDNNEWAVAELASEFPNVSINLGDFEDLRPIKPYDYVIHAAAYKHVNLGETNVAQFIENNVNKTIEFYKNMGDGNIGRLLYISTDKAVEPISAYGMTKALAERLTWAVGGQVARCGNFLQSSGSVIPIWEKQISQNEPLSITDPEMVRYVIELSDAAKQIWEGFLAEKTLIVPSMKKVRLMDFAHDVLRRHNIEPENYQFDIIGKRPGEKLEEKLMWPEEEDENTRNGQ